MDTLVALGSVARQAVSNPAIWAVLICAAVAMRRWSSAAQLLSVTLIMPWALALYYILLGNVSYGAREPLVAAGTIVAAIMLAAWLLIRRRIHFAGDVGAGR